MAKESIYLIRDDTKKIRNRLKFYYEELFFNKWMNKYDFDGLNYQQKQYFMKKMWSEGNIAVSSIASGNPKLAGLMIDKLVDMGTDSIILTPWTNAGRYNIYDYPTNIRLVNTRGVKFITDRSLVLDKEVVVIYAMKSHKSVYSSIEAKIHEIVDLEMKKRVALKSQSQPWLFVFDPEDYETCKKLQEQMENDSPYMFVPAAAVDKVKSITSGAQYIVDKIQAQIDGRINEVLTRLGINNVGVDEKKEHLVVDEINANNEDIATNDYSYKDEIESGWERVYNVLGYKVSVIDNSKEFIDEEEQVDEEEDNNDDRESE